MSPKKTADVAAEMRALTDEQICERLAGIYRMPVNDGAGPLNGKMEFVRRFPVGALQQEAAKRLRAYAGLPEQGPVADDAKTGGFFDNPDCAVKAV